MEKQFLKDITTALQGEPCNGVQDATATQLYRAISRAALKRIYPLWHREAGGKQAAYLSAEFLLGRMTFANLLNMGLLDETVSLLSEKGADIRMLEQIRDPALGNGGLGRLAACYLDAAATKGIRLNGYGIRYRYGLFRQTIENGFQVEQADNWTATGDPWSVRREEDKLKIELGDGDVYAVPYDMPVVGYGGHTVNTLRLWQAEAVIPFDFTAFDSGRYAAAFAEKTAADTLTAVLYPNDSTAAGKKLRLKQQYFFAAASVRDMVRAFKRKGGADFARFADSYTLQLNDTHPVVAIPELVRLLLTEGVSFDDALTIARQVFAYTNHTIMPEALEKWDVRLFKQVLPHVYPVVRQIQQALRKQLRQKGVTDFADYDILCDGQVHMARMALFASHAVNGVAAIHTDLLKTRVLPHWYQLFPERFHNITNGITPRRWLALANPELAALITDRIGGGWVADLDTLRELRVYADDTAFLEQLRFMRQKKKKQLAAYIEKQHGLTLRWDFMLDVQAKRLHEYKRQLMNALSVLDICFALQDGELPQFRPTAFLFAAKAAPGYYRAKAVIKLINAVSAYVEKDPQLSGKVQVLFIPDYSVSLAEKLIPAADISEQISTAGTEASGTGNMKFMLNGVPTLGTYDGANIEIVERAGKENNYIFGATVEILDSIRETYDPSALLADNPRLKRVVDALIDGTLDDGGSGMFADLHRSLTAGADADHYYVLGDFAAYTAARLQANADYGAGDAFAKKGLLNIASAGFFSADRAIEEYAEHIWHI
ncbi:MAG: glycogen/starch/alpha-glucan family phosphorylase [Clostridia bacterium]|nr:glycogen/starch/alpha-glucan family phosphorylase [Clostridia bacterium]